MQPKNELCIVQCAGRVTKVKETRRRVETSILLCVSQMDRGLYLKNMSLSDVMQQVQDFTVASSQSSTCAQPTTSLAVELDFERETPTTGRDMPQT